MPKGAVLKKNASREPVSELKCKQHQKTEAPVPKNK